MLDLGFYGTMQWVICWIILLAGCIFFPKTLFGILLTEGMAVDPMGYLIKILARTLIMLLITISAAIMFFVTPDDELFLHSATTVALFIFSLLGIFLGTFKLKIMIPLLHPEFTKPD